MYLVSFQGVSATRDVTVVEDTDSLSEWSVDVNDCARLHVAALINSSIENRRIFAFAEAINWTDIVAILRELRPNNEKIPDAPINEGRDHSEVECRVEAEDILRNHWSLQGWTRMNQSIAAGVADLL
jgi:hypothetical protein